MRSTYISLFLLSTLITSILESSQAQSRQEQKTDSVLVLVGRELKAKNADGLYALTGKQYHQSISADKFRNIAVLQLFPLGEIKKVSTISFVNNKTATYKVQFEVLTMEVRMSLDENDKMELFFLRPFKIESADKAGPVATSNPLRSVQDKKVDTVARAYIQKLNTTGLSIGILKNGIISLYNYGETKKYEKQLPTSETIFEIGSITKTFTATILASYVNEGKLKLTDLIIKYLPDSVASNPELKDITLLNLINHTSGIPSLPANLTSQKPYDKLNPYANYNAQLLFAYLKTCTLVTKPGTHYAYSNLAVGLLGNILERVSGKTFEELVSTMICKPLDMKVTMQHLYPVLKPRFAPVYNDDGEQTLPWDFDVLASCGALRSTAGDLLLYAKANLNDDGTSQLPKAIKLTHEVTYDKDAKLALAWHIILVDGVSYYFHNGGTYGSSSFLAFNKEKNLAVIVLSNAGPSTDATGVDIIKKLQ